MMPSDIPPELGLLSSILDEHPPATRELFQYAFALLAVEDGKAQIVGRPWIEQREHITFQTIAGEVFTLAKPAVAESELERIAEIVREVLQTESDHAA